MLVHVFSLPYWRLAILSILVYIKTQSEYVPLGKPLLCVQVQVRLQRPTVVAEIGFMLSVTKFFVPGVTMSGITPTPFESNDVVLEGKPAVAAVPTDHCLQLNMSLSSVSLATSCHVACIA